MRACKRVVTIADPGRLVLSDLPFEPGQRVEIVMIAEEESRGAAAELRRLLKETQELPSARTVTEEQIAEEVAAYRANR